MQIKKLIMVPVTILILTSCQSSYLTPKGERLLQNTAIGCIAGDIFFDNCKAGAAVGAGATVIDDQTD